MRNFTLVLAGLATCTAGVLGGIAANPVMRPTIGGDWRERYRAPARAADVINPVIGDYAISAWRPLFSDAEQPAPPPGRHAWAEVQALPVPPESPVLDDPWAGQAEEASLARRAVAAALDLTAGINAERPVERGEAGAAVDEDAPAQAEP